jgi:hypothetical protein
MEQMGFKKIQSFKESDKLFQILSSYMNDGAPDVRLNARKSLLSLLEVETVEVGEGVYERIVKNRDEVEKLVRKILKKEYEIHKIMKLLDSASEDEN